MAYTRHYWECNEVVTASALNNLESGVEEALECCGSGGGGEETVSPVLAIYEEVESNVHTLDKTWQEIYDAMSDGILCFVVYEGEDTVLHSLVYGARINGGVYETDIGSDTYTATTADDYPTYTSLLAN